MEGMLNIYLFFPRSPAGPWAVRSEANLVYFGRLNISNRRPRQVLRRTPCRRRSLHFEIRTDHYSCDCEILKFRTMILRGRHEIRPHRTRIWNQSIMLLSKER